MLFHLSDYQVIRIEGVDAEIFLHGQLTCDVKHLAENASTLTAHCDPKGKVHSLFRLLRSNNAFYAIVESRLLDTTLNHLKKYAVFSKVSFEVLDWLVLGTQSDENPTVQPTLTLPLTDGRRLLLCDHALFLREKYEDLALWQIACLKMGVPYLNSETIDQFIPQALGLEKMEDCLSFTKGCYLGQEMIARAKYRGINKQTLALFTVETAEPLEGQSLEMQLEDHWRTTGTILHSLHYEGVQYVQAVVNSDNLVKNFRFSGQAVFLYDGEKD